MPRRKDEPGKGGFWRINPDYNDMIENGIFKKRRSSRDGQPLPNSCSPPTLPIKRIKEEPLDDGYPDCREPPSKVQKTDNRHSVFQIGAHDDDAQGHLKGDFNWTSILNQDIEIGGVKIKTEDLIDSSNDDAASPIMAMSPPSSDSNSVSDFAIDDLLGEADFSNSDTPIDFTTRDNLSLEVIGTGIKAPDWWADSLNAGEQRGLLQNIENIETRSGLNTPVASSPVHYLDESAHPWFDNKNEYNIDTPFDVDNLFDIENIPSPSVSWF